MTPRFLSALLLLAGAHAQLRPRRVGMDAYGDQEVEYTDVPTGGAMGGGSAALNGMAGGMEGLAEAMEALKGGAGGLDMDAIAKMMSADNPMIKAMTANNPELAEALANPEALKQQMEQVTRMMSTPEGQKEMGGMMENMVNEMKNVMTDPEKLRSNLEMMKDNPMFESLAENIPGLKEMLDDPGEMASKVSEMFQSMEDPEKAQEMMSQLGGLGGENMGKMMEGIQKMMGGGAGAEGLEGIQQAMAQLMGGAGGGEDGDLLAGLGGGDDDLGGGGGADLKARVREQMAQMMNKRRAGSAAMEDEEF